MCRSPLGHDIEIESAMVGNLIHHEIKKRHPGFKMRLSRSVEIDSTGNLGFKGVSGNFCGTLHNPVSIR